MTDKLSNGFRFVVQGECNGETWDVFWSDDRDAAERVLNISRKSGKDGATYKLLEREPVGIIPTAISNLFTVPLELMPLIGMLPHVGNLITGNIPRLLQEYDYFAQFAGDDPGYE